MAAWRRRLPRLLLLLPLCTATLFCHGVRGVGPSIQCGTQKFEIPSTYATNVDRLLSKLRDEAIASNDFCRESVTLGASDVDGVAGHAVCYTDHSRQECAQCLRDAVPRFGDECPNARNASIFYEACLLFYFHQPITLSQFPYGPYGSIVTERVGLDLTGNDAAATSFHTERDRLLGDLRDRAISSGQYAATGSTESAAAGSIYGLVQCVLALTQESCRYCLSFLILSVSSANGNMQNKTIAALKGYWCYIRYETKPFNTYISEYVMSVSPARAPATAPAEAAPTTAARPPPPRQGIMIGVISCSVVLVTIAIILLLWCLRGRISSVLGTEVPPAKITRLSSFTPKKFSASQLKAATNNFADQLGTGHFGAVYKGTMRGKDVAVKKLRSQNGVGATDFASEAAILMAFKHKNLVKLLGYCGRGEDRLLCFEYLNGGSLDKLIYEGGIDWTGRYKIVQGICSGLHYLHHELDQEHNIVHMDLKASNVLISRGQGGEITSVKIADFGLSRFFRACHTHSYTEQVVGMRRYMAPEYLSKGRISPKADIYSFGVLILEIVSGRRVMPADDSSGDFITLVRQEWSQSQGDVRTLVYPADLPSDCYTQARNCVEIALECVEEDPNTRPDAEKIRQRLAQV